MTAKTPKNKGGRPPLYDTPEKMQKVIDAYFAECDIDDRPYTIAGLALALDMDRSSINNYQSKDEFFLTIKRAKLRIEARLEERLDGSNATGTIFNLKNNFGWKDVQQQEVSGADGGPVEIKGDNELARRLAFVLAQGVQGVDG